MDSRFSLASAGGSLKIINIGGPSSSSSGSGGGRSVHSTGTAIARDSFPHQPSGQTFTIANESILLQLHDGKQYLVDESSISNIDQMPPENLIYMNPTAAVIDGGDGSFETTEELVQLVTSEEMEETSKPLQPNDCNEQQQQQQQYQECEEVMEEVITDDWVQSQDDECVTVSIDQLGNTVGGTSLEDDISVPLDQDKYTLSRPFPCDFCSRRFRKMSSLEQHLLCHSNVRLHTCNLCNSHFEKRSDLTAHLQQHAFLSNENEETFASDHGGDYDTTISRTNPQYRSAHTSDDDETAIYIENAGMGYNAQPPMQLISTSPSYSSTHASPTRSLTHGAGSSTMSGSKPFADQQSLRSKQAKSPRSGRSARPYIKQEPGTTTLPSYPTEDEGPPSVTFPVKDPRKPFVCQQCGVGFAREKALDSHSRIHGGESKIECGVCGEMFWNRMQLQTHERQRHPEGQQKSAKKRKTTSTTTTHNAKVSSSSSASRGNAFDIEAVPQGDDFDLLLDPQYDCDNCGASFAQPDRLKRHIQQMHGLVPIGFDPTIVKQEVNIETSTGYDYEQQQHQQHQQHEQHELDDHDTQDDDDEEEMDSGDDYSEDRGMGTLDKSSVYEGQLSSHDTELAVPIKCQLCGETFQSEHEIKQHLQEQHMEQMTSTSCVICGKRCTNQSSLIKHSWDHSRVRRHCCPQCDKTFHHKARLKRHMESHRNKSVKCEQCGESFPDGRSLMNHRHSHTKSSKFPCTECGKTFGSRSSQQIHIRIHTGERPYACRFCWKAFADGGTLRKHERIHTGEKPYGCSVCTKAFNQRVVLREHIRAHHSQIDNKRGTPEQPYYCDACGALFASSNDLVQHLIEHSDKTTADKRKPQIFPRKYKRRRKLKPQELERLQSGRRKKKPSAAAINRSTSQEEFDEDDRQEAASSRKRSYAQDDSNGRHDHAEDTDSSIELPSDTASANNSLDNGEGSLKISSELFLDYGGSVQKVIASPKFISPYELLDDAQKQADQSTAKTSSHTLVPVQNAAVDGEMIIMDDHGINLLSEVVLVHGVNNNHDGSKKATTAQTKQLVSGSLSRTTSSHSTAKRTSSSSATLTKDNRRNKKNSSVCSSTKDGGSSPVKNVTGKGNNAVPSATTSAKSSIATFPTLASGRLHASRVLPSYVREISSSRISSGSFPLLDDGKSAHDTLEDEETLIGEQSIDHATTDGRGGAAAGSEERQRRRRRHFSSTSSCYDHGAVNDEDELSELNQRLLSEISNRDRYTDRYNSDIVNDLAEILRSPIKNVPINGPPRDILATPTAQRALPFFEATLAAGVSNVDALLPLDGVKLETVDEDTQSPRVLKREAVNCGRNSGKNSQTSKQPTKKGVSSGSVRTGSSPLRIPRLTRRQLEKEINFLKEAFGGDDTSTGVTDPLPAEAVGSRLSRDSFSFGEDKSTQRIRQSAKTNASEELATMLLNDQIPTTSTSGQQREEQQQEQEDIATTMESSAVTIVKQEVVDYSDDIDNDDDMFGGFASDVGQEESDGESADLQSATSSSFAGFRCSICDECFKERKQLMLHVQLHI